MALYHFVTDIRLAASPEQVWAVLADPTTWTAWWRPLRRVQELVPGRTDGVGRRYRMEVRTALPYTLAFDGETVRIRPPVLWEATISGELAGTGLYEVLPRDGGVEVRHTWIVRTTKPWMNALAPLARPVFAWNHAVLMREFAAGLAGELGVPLLATEERQIRPGEPGFGRLSPSGVG